jgi:hypothetical protein
MQNPVEMLPLGFDINDGTATHVRVYEFSPWPCKLSSSPLRGAFTITADAKRLDYNLLQKHTIFQGGSFRGGISPSDVILIGPARMNFGKRLLRLNGSVCSI